MTSFKQIDRAARVLCVGTLLAATPLALAANAPSFLNSAAAAAGGNAGGGGAGGNSGGGGAGGNSGGAGNSGNSNAGGQSGAGHSSGAPGQSGNQGNQGNQANQANQSSGKSGGQGSASQGALASAAGALNAAHASPQGRAHAAPGSTVGHIATYERSMIAAAAMPTATPAQLAARNAAVANARSQLAATTNKDLTPAVVGRVDSLLGLPALSAGASAR